MLALERGGGVENRKLLKTERCVPHPQLPSCPPSWLPESLGLVVLLVCLLVWFGLVCIRWCGYWFAIHFPLLLTPSSQEWLSGTP